MKGNLDFFAMNSTFYGKSMACVIRMGGNISEYLKSTFRRNLFGISVPMFVERFATVLHKAPRTLHFFKQVLNVCSLSHG